MDYKYQALNKGLFKHTTNPGLIKEVSLLNYLPNCINREWLVKEVVYCLITSIGERLNREQYRVAYFSCATKDWKLKAICSKVEYFKSLDDLIIVDISILETDRDLLFANYKWFKHDLIIALNTYGE